ncbi:phosphatase PAP2 family protein [Tomitella biformata]|uniref:phosphatase PAP2 family protein n=1 Tax=Tomitella biformata TaxID=630403 RepID=UPI0004ADAADA|nr:phosphatase PAP2 family protein [Tomitella biformata]
MPRIRHWQFTSALLIAMSVGLGLAVSKADWLVEQDIAISENLRALDSGWVHAVMWTASAVFSPVGGAAIMAILALGLVLRQRMRDAVMTLFVIGCGWLSAMVLKALIDRPRPPLAAEVSASYPSGHVALATAIVFAVFLLIRSVDWRDTVAVAGALLIVLIAFSRVISGAHYLTDTVGAVLLVSGVVIGLSGLWQFADSRLTLWARPDAIVDELPVTGGSAITPSH